jgi:hypothetical protein
MRAQRHFNAAALAVSLIAGASGCSVALDWDVLTNGSGVAGPCGEAPCAPETVWAVPCHSVFVTADETEAFVTRYALTPEPPGLYRVDLLSKSPTEAGAFLAGDDFAAAGIAGDASHVVFATRDPAGGVWSVETAAPNTSMKVSAGVDAFGVALTAEGDIYWAERLNKVRAITAAGVEIDSWDIDGTPYYVAVHYEADAGGDVAYVAYTTGPDNPEGQVARLVVGQLAEVLFGGMAPVRGIAVRMLARPDSTIVPHIFVASSKGAKMAWQEADKKFAVTDLGGDPSSAAEMLPGEIVVNDTYVYWTTKGIDAPGGAVFRKAHRGESAPEKLGDDEQVPVGLHLTEDTLYWCSSSVKGLRRLKLKEP